MRVRQAGQSRTQPSAVTRNAPSGCPQKGQSASSPASGSEAYTMARSRSCCTRRKDSMSVAERQPPRGAERIRRQILVRRANRPECPLGSPVPHALPDGGQQQDAVGQIAANLYRGCRAASRRPPAVLPALRSDAATTPRRQTDIHITKADCLLRRIGAKLKCPAANSESASQKAK